MATQRLIKFESLANSLSATELATTNANTAKIQADTARDEALAAATEALASSDINPNYISYEVGVLPTTVDVPTGTIGAYFNNDNVFQKLELQGGVWVDIGEPITTKKYVDDNASLLQSNIDSGDENLQNQVDAFSSGDGKTYTSLTDAMAVDPLPADNTPFRVNGDADPDNDGNYIYLSSAPNGHDRLSDLINQSDIQSILDAIVTEGEPFEVA